jgi:stringent starvation protein B
MLMQEISTKPYLLRGLYEWCTDNGYTPHIAVRVDNQTRVPRQFVRDNEIVLNISFEATSQLQMGNELVEFNARFSGKSHRIEVPVANVLAIYARENGQGMAFPVDSPGGEAEDSGADDDAGEVDSPASVGGNAPAAVEADVKSSAAPSLASSTEKNDDGSDTPRPDDDGSKGGGRGHLKVVK